MPQVYGVRLNDFADGQRIASASGTSFNPAMDIPIAGVDKNGACLGGVLFKEYTGIGGSIAMHVAGFHPRWISRNLLYVAFDYPFNQLGVKKIFGQVPSWKEDVLRFDLRAGFKIEGQIKDVYPDGDMILLSLYREECRFLGITPKMALPREVKDGRKT